MGPDDDIHQSFGHILEHLPDFFGGQKTAENFNPDGITGEALAKVLQMLFCQDGSGRQDPYLFSVHDGKKGRPQCHLGFPITDIAADQTIHRLVLLHITQGLIDGALLVRGLFEFKGCFKLPIKLLRDGEGPSFMDLTNRINSQEFLGHGEDGLACFCLYPFPRASAQTIQRGLVAAPAHILLHKVDSMDR